MSIGRLLYRLVQVGCGASLGFLSLVAGVTLFFYLVHEWRTLNSAIVLLIILSLTLLSSFFVLALRLLAGRRRADDGLFPPWGLRVVGAVYIALPIAALLAGQWRGLRLGFLLVQGAGYLLFGLALFQLAAKRKWLRPSPHHPQSDA